MIPKNRAKGKLIPNVGYGVIRTPCSGNEGAGRGVLVISAEAVLAAAWSSPTKLACAVYVP